MALLKVCRMGHPMLRRRSAEVPPERLGEPALQRLIDDMVETMVEEDGVGLAAPQVYAPLRVVVLGEPGLDPDDEDGLPLQVLVNPRLVGLSAETEEAWEGCLSIPGLRGPVPRARTAHVAALDREGRQVTVRARGLHARVLQHEVDHLDGILFLDRMTDLRRLSFFDEYDRYWKRPPAAGAATEAPPPTSSS